jgi:NTP pyrophosphatase (non-canonical NTP hydrolase)
MRRPAGQPQASGKQFIDAIARVVSNAHELVVKNGFWSEECYTPMGLVAKLGLITCEVAEVIECVRRGPDEPSAKCPDLTCEEEECADIFLRLADYCGARGIDLGTAALVKHEYNKTRPFKHGKKA